MSGKHNFKVSLLLAFMLQHNGCVGMNPYATLENICKPDRPMEQLLFFLNEKSLNELSLVNKKFHHDYPAWSETKRDYRVKELNELESDDLNISIENVGFDSLCLQSGAFKINHIGSFSLLPISMMVPAKKPFFVCSAKINWRKKKEQYGDMECLVDCTYPSEGPMEFKHRNLDNRGGDRLFSAMYSTDIKKKMLVIYRRERYVHDFQVLMPELKVIRADLDYEINNTIVYSEQREQAELIIGSPHPEQIWLVCKNNGDVVMEKDCFQTTDLFGELVTLEEVPRSIRKHVRSSTEAKTYTTEYKKEDGIIKKTNQYLLQQKETDSSWAPGVLPALRRFIPWYKNSRSHGRYDYHHDSVSMEDCTRFIIALALESEGDLCRGFLRSAIDRKIWAPIPETNKEINAIGRVRQKRSEFAFWWTGKEYEKGKIGYSNVSARCESLIPLHTLNPDTVSFTDGKKITPLKPHNMIQKKANENAAEYAAQFCG
jgi:hypothetical protein